MNLIEYEHRGFRGFRFFDTYRVECSIQESSVAADPRIWLGVDQSPGGSDGRSYEPHRMHLNIEQAKDLIDLLECFVENGDLRHRDCGTEEHAG